MWSGRILAKQNQIFINIVKCLTGHHFTLNNRSGSKFLGNIKLDKGIVKCKLAAILLPQSVIRYDDIL